MSEVVEAMLIQQATAREKQEARARAIFNGRKKSPAVAVFLAVLLGCFGLFYSGRFGAGVLYICACLTLVGIPFAWVYGVCVASRDVNNYNEMLKLELGL